MNCDQAFDQMTDSDLASRDELRAHLDACPRCRQMLETLSPALEAFGVEQQTIVGGGMIVQREEDGMHVAQEAAARLATRPRALQRFRRRASWRPAGVLLFAGIVLLAFVAGLAVGPSATQAPAVGVADASNCTWLHAPEPGGPTSDSRTVVLSCVACHLGGSSQ